MFGEVHQVGHQFIKLVAEFFRIKVAGQELVQGLVVEVVVKASPKTVAVKNKV